MPSSPVHGSVLNAIMFCSLFPISKSASGVEIGHVGVAVDHSVKAVDRLFVDLPRSIRDSERFC
jgi:hypothetical protein